MRDSLVGYQGFYIGREGSGSGASFVDNRRTGSHPAETRRQEARALGEADGVKYSPLPSKTMKHGDKVGIGALAIFLLGALPLCAMGIWLNSPIWHWHLETPAFCLLWSGFFISIYAGFRGSRWWFLLPASLVCFWLWLATSKYAG
jgi:hypothetical protein